MKVISHAAIAALLCACSGLASAAVAPAAPSVTSATGKTAKPSAANVVVIIMENRDYDLVIGSSDAPYINGTLVPQAALMTNSHAIGHPSQPNYLAFFSGSTQGVDSDNCPYTFSTGNAGEELLSSGKTFAGYSESMPYGGYTGCSAGEYARKHNPWVDFSNVPASSNLVYNGFPKKPPALTIIVPNLCNDMHDCSTQTGDAWLEKHVPAILTYNQKHHGLFILTWDEASPDKSGTNQIATLLIGPMVTPGSYNQDVTHYSVLRTIEKVLAVPCTANACTAAEIKQIWR
jgi:phosphatidylinositol-3-phosphatase